MADTHFNFPRSGDDGRDVWAFMDQHGIPVHLTENDRLASILRGKGLIVYKVERHRGCYAWQASVRRCPGFNAATEATALRLRRILDVAGIQIERGQPWLKLGGPRLYFGFTWRAGRPLGVQFMKLTKAGDVPCRIEYPASR